MKYTVLICALTLMVACSKKEQSEERVGTAMNSAYSEVIGSQSGYIIENAQLAGADETPIFSLEKTCNLIRGTGSVMIIHTKDEKSSANTILALQFPVFTDGTELAYAGEPGSGGFFVYGYMGNEWLGKETGLISGTLRMMKKEASDINLGLNRDVMNGTGEMEIVVSGIDPAQLNVPKEKKYAARFELPIITLDELMKINTPS
jgi:hypothetical protein